MPTISDTYQYELKPVPAMFYFLGHGPWRLPIQKQLNYIPRGIA